MLRQRDFLSTVVNTAKSIFCVVTPGGAIVRFNSFCEQLTGIPDDELARGRPFWELFAAPEHAAAVREAFEADVPGSSTRTGGSRRAASAGSCRGR